MNIVGPHGIAVASDAPGSWAIITCSLLDKPLILKILSAAVKTSFIQTSIGIGSLLYLRTRKIHTYMRCQYSYVWATACNINIESKRHPSQIPRRRHLLACAEVRLWINQSRRVARWAFHRQGGAGGWSTASNIAFIWVRYLSHIPTLLSNFRPCTEDRRNLDLTTPWPLMGQSPFLLLRAPTRNLFLNAFIFSKFKAECVRRGFIAATDWCRYDAVYCWLDWNWSWDIVK